MKQLLKSVFLLLFFVVCRVDAAPAQLSRQQKAEIAALQKELGTIEKAFDESEKNFWPQYFGSKYSKDYQQISTALDQLDQRIRRFKNRILALQKQKLLPLYINFARNCALEQDISRMKLVLSQHRLHGEWEIKKPMRLTSRDALKYKRTIQEGAWENMGLSPADEVYLLRVNHRLNYDLKYHFAHVSNHCKQYHDCRKYLHGGNLDARISLLGIETSEYFSAVWQMRLHLLRLETLLHALGSGYAFPPELPQTPSDIKKRIASLTAESRNLLELVCDDFWCGFYCHNHSAKYQTLTNNVSHLRNNCRTIRNLLGGKGKTFHLDESASRLLELLRPDRRLSFATDWSETGWTFLRFKQIEAGDPPEKLVPAPCPKAAAAGKGKKKKSKDKDKNKSALSSYVRTNTVSFRTEKLQLEKYRKAVQELQTGIGALAAEYLKDEPALEAEETAPEEAAPEEGAPAEKKLEAKKKDGKKK